MHTRGKPNSDALIHAPYILKGRSEPLCRNGSYHIKLAHHHTEVTCEVCKQKLHHKWEA